MKLDRAFIAARIPHAGSMCLLDGVEDWATDFIVCRASSHREPENPLRAAERLGVLNGIEYCAQAMAVHGALLAGADTAPRAGYLTSVREVIFYAERLDDIKEDLLVRADQLSGDGNHLIYHFRLETVKALLLTGRASVFLNVKEKSS